MKKTSGFKDFLKNSKQNGPKNTNTLAENTCLTVPQKYCGFARAGHGKTDIGTWGMAPCIGLALYQSESQCAAVAHFDSDGANTPQHFALSVTPAIILHFLSYASSPVTKAYIVLGSAPDDSSHCLSHLLKVALQRMSSNFGFPIITTESDPTHTSGAFAISLETGDLQLLGPNAAPIHNNPQLHDNFSVLRPNFDIFRLQIPFIASNAYEAP
ncbi:hypothetical protein WAE56_06605 [Iodobacter sp. LRB]|uniref:hypothetical protein n=1 Tax=unclassified Iodobacter TaxID=235634 RepID=UPI000C0FAF40|nr:hypothetical protein [Iodobacter sp. BJB302]PHV01714.1 hypothetical protein CSQ88_10730 [Iodobacter sp. BJB302]